jgi:hypothetical protein
MNIRSFAAYCVLLASAFASSQSDAQDAGLQSYEVELIIFRVNRPNASPENWALAQSAAKGAIVRDEEESPTASTPAVPPSETPAPVVTETVFPALSAAQLRMNGIEETLRKGKTYQPLAHIGWIQPGFPLGSSPKLSLQSYLPGFLPEGVALSGEVSLSRGPRLLHLMLDLTYQGPDGQRYVLRETRRMKSTEKHYLDHPYFGVIALVTPKN